MTWRFRKWYKSGPLRWTVSKRGIGFSWGILPFRIGMTPSGDRYLSFTIPHTGLSWVKFFRKKAPRGVTPTVSGGRPASPAPNRAAQSPQTARTNSSQPWWKQPGLKP